MTSSHAIALALLGWYLMRPPIHLDSETPALREWQIMHSFDSARACEEQRAFDWTHATDKATKALNHQAVCIASDDPRLAK